jgi:hypothetical protein
MLSHQDIQEIVANVQFSNWKFILTNTPPVLHVEFVAPDLVTGEVETQKSRKWLLSYWMTRSEVVQTCFLAIMTAVEHELRESFKYKDKAIYGPHFDVEWLLQHPEFDIRKELAS